jgi:tetratricopeptide (TPR) repeat protein
VSQKRTLTELLKRSEEASRRQDWLHGEKINQEILLEMRGVKKLDSRELVSIAKRYLRSILGDGHFLLNDNHSEKDVFIKKVDGFKKFIQSNPLWHSVLEDTERDLHEIQLFLRMSRADARNKAANALRRLGRPDLSINLCNYLLSITKLNYYVLTSRSWAFADLGHLDRALDDAQLALKHQPKGNNYPQTALSRAYRMRFKRDGDIADSESSIFWGHEALSAKRNIYAASQLIASLIASGVDKNNPEILKLEKEFPNITRPADRVAIESATEVIHDNFSVTEEDFEEFESPEEDSVELTEEATEDYFEDYFSEYVDSINNPRSPHLEP